MNDERILARIHGRSAAPVLGQCLDYLEGPAGGRAMIELDFDRGFPPIVGAAPRALILGSLPGRRSLAERQYYAQPQNAFWRLMGELVDAGPAHDYATRLERLKAGSLALWDVLASGQRPGSLDAAIVKSTVVTNDFSRFFASHGGIELVCFNGKTAAALYTRHVVPVLPAEHAAIPCITLPSTSPAHASMRFEAKLARWSEALAPVLSP
jgi:hypoxanthine-DNA glycosylase